MFDKVIANMLFHGYMEILVVLTMNPTGELENVLLLDICNVMTIKELLYIQIFFLTFLQLTANEGGYWER